MNTFETDFSKHAFPAIAKAAVEMAYANGGINRHRREDNVLRKLDRLLSETSVAMDHIKINEWLANLTYEELQIVVDGEEVERDQFMRNAPAGTNALLDQIFDKAV